MQANLTCQCVLPCLRASAASAPDTITQACCPPLLLTLVCSVCAAEGCDATKGLKKCSGCKAVRYCCREHQVAHWAAHKHECRQRAAEMRAAAEAGPAAAEAVEGGAAEWAAAHTPEAASASAADAEE